MKPSPTLASLLLGLSAPGQAEPPPKPEPVELSGLAADAKGSAILMAVDGQVLHIGGLDAWPDDLSGRFVRVTGVLATAHLFPEATQGPDGGWSQGVAPGSPPSTVLRDASWAAIPSTEETPWTLRFADGSGNLTVVERASDASDILWRYEPVSAEQSSSGVYSGGEPGRGTLTGPRAERLWSYARALESVPSLHASTRAMGTGQLTLRSPRGERVVLIDRGSPLSGFDAAVRSIREPG